MRKDRRHRINSSNNRRALGIISRYSYANKYDILTKQLTNKFQEITNECNDWSSIIFQMVKFQTKEDIINKIPRGGSILQIIIKNLSLRERSKTEEELYQILNKI